MPGFTAPKLLWVAKHEPDIFARTARVLLPKDWIRLRLTGEAVSEPSDAAGTLWLDVAKRRWSPAMLVATGLDERHMPRLIEEIEISGQLTREAANELRPKPRLPVAGGGGDNAAGAVGIGVIRPGAASEAELLSEIEAAGIQAQAQSRLVFLPYLSGERTPHNNPAATGVIFGLDAAASRADLGRAVLEGAAFALADGMHALETGGERIETLSAIGGGARSKLWGRILAAALECSLKYHQGGEIDPALEAARLARIAAVGANPDEACPPPPLSHVVEPEPDLLDALKPRQDLYRRIYPGLRSIFTDSIH